MTSGAQSLKKVHELIGSRIGMSVPKIYEAGGGSASSLPADVISRGQVTVVDIDKTQLERNAYAHEKVLGDIQQKEFPDGSFDLISCFNVIEHLDAPDKAIKHFFRALAPKGLLFIGAPNPLSFSGWITRVTPHWVHVQYYRRVLGYKAAGLPGSVPFPTVFNPVVRPPQLIEFCREIGFNVLYFCEYEGMIYENTAQRRPVIGKLLNLAVEFANAFVLWRRDLRNGDYHIVLEKPEANEDISKGLSSRTNIDRLPLATAGL